MEADTIYYWSSRKKSVENVLGEVLDSYGLIPRGYLSQCVIGFMENSLDEEGIIRPHKGRNDPALGSDVIMAMIPSDLAYLAGRSGASKVTFPGSRLCPLYVKEENETPFLALCGPFTGAPHAVMALEKLIVMGAKRVWVLGWCGSLQPDVRIGDILLPTLAISEEGTSRHYPVGNKSIQPDTDLHRMLLEYMEREQIPFSAGTVWTTDAVYRETPRKVREFQEQGVLGVEMEMSALFTVALYRSVAMAGLLVVSDELFDLKWTPGFSNPALKRGSRLAAEILLSIIGHPSGATAWKGNRSGEF